MKHVVGVGDMKISKHSGDTIITHALGSCLGVTIWDPVALVGGLLHVMLPLSTIDSDKAKSNPYMFVDTGVPRLFLDCYKAGAKKERLVVKVAGGACVHCNEGDDFFQIGKRNIIMIRKLLWKNGVMISGSDLGGSASRTVSLDIATGDVKLRVDGQERLL